MNAAPAAAAPPAPLPHDRGRGSWQKHMCWAHDLAPVSRHIGLVISLYTDDHGQQGVWLSALDVARLTGMGQSTVIRYRRLLEQAGWIANVDGAWFLAWPGDRVLAAGDPVTEARK